MNKYDVIIIGAGLGGLTAGSKLAKEGKKVLLIEQHDKPGGCATSFKRKDFILEAGLHEMDGLDQRDMKTRIFRDLGVSNKVVFLKVPELYRFVNNRVDMVMPHEPEQAKHALRERFPAEEKGINDYFHRLLNARQIMKESEGMPDTSVGDFLDTIIRDEDLKLVLLGNLGYFHDDPYALSLNYYAIAQASYFSGGGNFIRGGSQVLSDYLAGSIQQHGGDVLLRHVAEKILVEGGKATGVIFREKSSGKLQTQAQADTIIVNAAIPKVAKDLLPGEQGSLMEEKTKELTIGPSLLTVYFGFSKPLKETGNRHYSTFFFDPSVKTQADIAGNNRGPFAKRSFVFVDYGQLDSALAPEGKSVGAVCCTDYSSDWEQLEEEQYRLKKETVAQTFIQRLDSFFPGFQHLIEYYETGTPRTIERYTMNPGGAVYGFAQAPGKTRSGESDLLDNLYVASAWGKYGGGFSGAIYCGYMCALDILRKR